MSGQAATTGDELVASAKLFGTIALALFGLIFFLPLLLVCALSVIAYAVDGSYLGAYPIWQASLLVVLMIIGALGGFAFVSMAIVAVWDLRLPQPVVRVDSAGVFDRRLSPNPIPWSNIERVFIRAAQNSGIELHLRTPQPTSLNHFRLGGLLAWRRRDDKVAYLALNDLVGPSLNRDAMSQMAVRNGAEVVMHYNESWNEIRRPVPKP